MTLADKSFGVDRLIRLVSGLNFFFSSYGFYDDAPGRRICQGCREGYYFSYAMIVKEGGVAQFPALLRQHLSDKVAQLYPHPGRIGYVLLTAGWLSIFPDSFFLWRGFPGFALFCFSLSLSGSRENISANAPPVFIRCSCPSIRC
jgi:hypothetical protein